MAGKSSGTGGTLVRVRCRCGAVILFGRRKVGETHRCEKCGEVFSARADRDERGKERVVTSLRTPSNPPAGSPEGRTDNHRKEDTGGGIGSFMLEMMSEGNAAPEARTPEPDLDAVDFQLDADPASGPGEKADTELIEALFYSTCPCREPVVVRRDLLGRVQRCPKCRRNMVVELVHDSRTDGPVLRARYS